jgi:hypothetical protein
MWLARFHDAAAGQPRPPGSAIIPAMAEPIRALWQINQALLGFLQTHRQVAVATLDMDATLIETHKREALPCYKGFKAYQPLNCWWAEQGVVLHSEFRDGNVPAGHQQLRVLKDCLAVATGITKVYLRRRATSRTCCCTVGKARFGVIEFAVSADVTEEFRKAARAVADADWQPLYRRASITRPTRSSPRFASCRPGTAGGVPASWRSANPCGSWTWATLGSWRFPLRSSPPASSCSALSPTARCQVIWWLRERCGKSEEAHAVMKLAGCRGGCSEPTPRGS